jgi:NADPH:quinone reductase-like Zn-dependent oxidoreductase
MMDDAYWGFFLNGLIVANSGVGQFVIALAKRAGIKTPGDRAPGKVAEQVREFGADLVVLDGVNLGDRVALALGDASLRILFDAGAQELGELAA